MMLSVDRKVKDVVPFRLDFRIRSPETTVKGNIPNIFPETNLIEAEKFSSYRKIDVDIALIEARAMFINDAKIVMTQSRTI